MISTVRTADTTIASLHYFFATLIFG